MGYAHRNPAHNDRRYSEPTKPEQIQFAPGWTADKWLDLLEVWHDWHLNDMKPNCQHQTGPDWDTSKEITLYYFRLSQEAENKIKAAKERAEVGFMTGQGICPTAEETELFNLKNQITYHSDTLPEPLKKWYVPNGPVYPGDHYNKASEVKTAGQAAVKQLSPAWVASVRGSFAPRLHVTPGRGLPFLIMNTEKVKDVQAVKPVQAVRECPVITVKAINQKILEQLYGTRGEFDDKGSCRQH